MEWKDKVVEAVQEEITNIHAGRWPRTLEEWQRLAERFGCTIHFHSNMAMENACLIENILHVPLPTHFNPVSHPGYQHELSEACLLWEGREPCIVPATDMQRARHDVANLAVARYLEACKAEYEALTKERAELVETVVALETEARQLVWEAEEYNRMVLISRDRSALKRPDYILLEKVLRKRDHFQAHLEKVEAKIQNW